MPQKVKKRRKITTEDGVSCLLLLKYNQIFVSKFHFFEAETTVKLQQSITKYYLLRDAKLC